MGPVFYQKIMKFLKNGPIFQEKPKNGYPFLAKSPLKMGKGFWGSSGTPLSNSNLSTPPGVLRVFACHSGTQMRVRDSSATRIFF